MAADTSAKWRRATASWRAGFEARLVSVFISSPGAVVPLHIDTQHNVLAEVTGTKEVTVGQITEAEIEQCITSGVRNLRAPPEAAETFVVRAGEGLYIPPFTPHSVLGLDGISISLSSMWTTTWSWRPSAWPGTGTPSSDDGTPATCSVRWPVPGQGEGVDRHHARGRGAKDSERSGSDRRRHVGSTQSLGGTRRRHR